ncbi:hypothetical protein F3Y22_tig00110569pilonHSYRG00228 [Hibiscus syriacus]|uniref:PGG domain-containing protein n=1 Tax=Hibiscus syriacus TaxID=106335 RepID=A0A6A3A9U8_HIBSY|nr:hypothetical protein F3Y22_tig00110569pilonHSYRG00228 [Hibiscus syriacus]
MDTRLFESARTDNVDDLNKLLGENPMILHTISLYAGENPLHIASAVRHASYVREVSSLRPEYAEELNINGFSPLHMVATDRHIEVVRELLNVDWKLCCVEGRDHHTTLHFVAMKMRVDVIGEMLSCCVECIEGLLLGCGTTSSDLLEINAPNQCDLTAMDVLQMFPSEAGDQEITEALQRAEALRARDLSISPFPSYASSDGVINQLGTCRRCRRLTDNVVEYFKFKKGRDSPNEARSALLVIVVLVATATFQVGLNPLGGTWQDDNIYLLGN